MPRRDAATMSAGSSRITESNSNPLASPGVSSDSPSAAGNSTGATLMTATEPPAASSSATTVRRDRTGLRSRAIAPLRAEVTGEDRTPAAASTAEAAAMISAGVR